MGNKSDMEDERVISYERGKQLADSLGLQFFETSAKENINVRVRRERRLFSNLIFSWLERKHLDNRTKNNQEEEI